MPCRPTVIGQRIRAESLHGHRKGYALSGTCLLACRAQLRAVGCGRFAHDARHLRLRRAPGSTDRSDVEAYTRAVQLQATSRVPKFTEPQKTHDDSQRRAFGSLLLVAFIWGTVGPSCRLLFSMTHAPSSFLALASANIVAFVFLAARNGTRLPSSLSRKGDISGGVETGFWYYLGVLLICAGLERTSATHEAFLAQLVTVIVPCLQALQGVPVPTNIGLSCVMAFAGCVALGSGSADSSTVSLEGDVLCLCSAVAFAAHNIRLQAYAADGDVELIAFWSKATQAVIGILVLLLSQGSIESASFFSAASPIELLCLALWVLWNGCVVKGVAALWHAGSYRNLSPSEAEIVLATTPLWAFALAVVFLAEPVTPATMLGATLFTAALFLAAQPQKQQGS
eukprot:TRINITY_DN6278_c0_g1_i2.p1 TRINITY_DN6278_c0_g1~~TRINITY_DN6278_c0_g1_i2.p1  ORF type:complete len:405 (-),score=55.70 TRINITY_DN6278_c0_g1_i2:13-1203(-)